MRISLSGFTAFGRSFSSFLTGAVALWLSSSQSANSAGLIEPFSYNNGNLTSVSGGAWKLWGVGGNATVVNGAARFENTTDVIRPFPAVLTAPGEIATFSFTINVAAANTTEAYEVAFEPSSAPFGPGNTNYGSGLAFGFDALDAPAGMSSMQVAEGSGNFSSTNAGNNFVYLGNMTTGVTHTFALTLARGATYIDYSIFLDNVLLYSNNSFPPFFRITDLRAINSVEIDQAGAAGSPLGSALIDNITIVPEPASCALLAFGCAALLNFRRRPGCSPQFDTNCDGKVFV
jgi:hypothetical protein